MAEQVLTANPDDYYVLIHAADIAARCGNASSAEGAYRRAESMEPTASAPLAGLIDLFAATGKLDAAKAILERAQASTLRGDQAKLHRAKLAYFCSSGDCNAAFDAASLYYSASPSPNTLLHCVRSFLASKCKDCAERFLQRHRSAEPTGLELIAMGWVHHANERYEEAAASFRLSWPFLVQDASSLEAAADTFLKLRSLNEAERAVEEFLRISAPKPWAVQSLAFLRLYQHRNSEALEAATLLEKLEPSNPSPGTIRAFLNNKG